MDPLTDDDLFAGLSTQDGKQKVDDVARLMICVKNEQSGPELLPYESKLVPLLLELLNQQQDIIDKAMTSVQDRFKAHFFQMEVERVRYMLQLYLRTRLWKIQKYHQFILQDEDQKKLLSPGEVQFATDYNKKVGDHFDHTFLQYLPENEQIRSLKEPEMIVSPPEDRYVFIRVKEDIGEYQLSQTNKDDIETFSKGDIVLSPYKPIKPLLLDDKIDLI